MSCYTQLTQEERYHISVLCKERFPKAEIARRLNRHPSTITRELRRNTGRRGYRAKQAHQKALYRRCTAKKAIKFTRKTIRLVIERLKIRKINCSYREKKKRKDKPKSCDFLCL